MVRLPPYQTEEYYSGIYVSGSQKNEAHVQSSRRRKRRSRCRKSETANIGSLGAGQPFIVDAAAIAGHQHCKRRLADHDASVQRLFPTSSMDRARLPACHHDLDRQRRPARRPHRTPASVTGRHFPVYSGICSVRFRPDAVAVDCRAGGTRLRRGRDDGPHDGVCQ